MQTQLFSPHFASSYHIGFLLTPDDKDTRLCVRPRQCGKSVTEIRETIEAAYPGQGLSLSQVYRLIKDVEDGTGMREEQPVSFKATC